MSRPLHSLSLTTKRRDVACRRCRSPASAECVRLNCVSFGATREPRGAMATGTTAHEASAAFLRLDVRGRHGRVPRRRRRRRPACCGIISKDLPDYSQLQDYEPPVMTRVHAADGSLLAEYARERRLYMPIQAVPKLVHQRLHRGRGQEFLRARRPRFRRHRARGACSMCRTTAPAAGRRAPRPSPSRSPRTSCSPTR